MGGRNRVRDARELRIRVGENEFQPPGVRVGGVGEPAAEKERVLRAAGEDFKEEGAGGHGQVLKRS